MATRIATTVSSETDAGATKFFDVSEGLEEIMEKLVPVNPPTSALAQREAMTFTKSDGSGRVFIQTSMLSWIEENVDA